jgi:hypothetical protein
MRAFGGNDVLETLHIETQTERENVTQILEHQTQILDQRARYAFALLDHWGMMVTLADCMPDDSDHPRPKKLEPNELAMRICEVVDATWMELRHRGWIFEQPSLAKK